MPVLDLALLAPRREDGAYASFKKLASGARVGTKTGLKNLLGARLPDGIFFEPKIQI
jgi:hypothetical protein